MIRTLLLATVTTLGLTAPLALTSEAEAKTKVNLNISFGGGYKHYNPGYGHGHYYPPVVVKPVPVYSPGYTPAPVYTPAPPIVENHYHVMYRRCNHEPWREYGTYNCHEAAHGVEMMLRSRGFEATVEHH
jgi:hypothetical protein